MYPTTTTKNVFFLILLAMIQFLFVFNVAADNNNNGNNDDDTPCGIDWIQYKDEKCFILFDDYTRSFSDAQKVCAEAAEHGSLAVIHSQAEQDLLNSYVFDKMHKVDNVWIGAKFVTTKTPNAYEWIDQSKMDYTNWDIKNGLRNKTDHCIEMESDERLRGKWIDEPCSTKNLVVCQKYARWSLSEIQRTLLSMRSELSQGQTQTSGEIQQLRQQLSQANTALALMQKELFPIGFIYVQVSNEATPMQLWPSTTMKWQEVSAQYANVFFRVNGNAAAANGTIQEQSFPHINKIDTQIGNQNGAHNSVALKSGGGTSDILFVGGNNGVQTFLKFTTTNDEVRPRNVAVRIWKRIG